MTTYVEGALQLISKAGGGSFWDLGANTVYDMTGSGRTLVPGGGQIVGNQTGTNPYTNQSPSTFFDFVDDRLDLSAYNPWTGTNKTLFGWVKRNTTTQNNTFFASPGSGATVPQFSVNTGDDIIWRPAGSGGTTTTWTDAHLPYTNVWVFVALSATVGTNSSLYMNGSLVSTQANTSVFAGGSSLKIGARATTTDLWSGWQAGMGIVDGTLTAGDIAWLYSLGVTPATIISPSVSSPPSPRRDEVSPLSVNFEFYDSRDPRGGADERDVGVTLVDGEIDTELPGGYGPATLVFPRPESWSIFDSAQLAGCITSDDSGRTAHEGRVVGTPKTGSETIEVQLEGWIKSLEDNKSASVIFRDIDLSAWTGVSNQRRLNYMGSAIDATDGQLIGDASTLGIPWLITNLTGHWDRQHTVQMWYNANGNSIGQINTDWRVGGGVNSGDTQWHWVAGLSPDDIGAAGTTDLTADLRAAGPSNVTLNATTTTKRYAWVESWYGAAGGGEGTDYWIMWRPAVYGLTGLTKRGTEPSAGYYVSDMVPYIVKQWGPKLQVTPDSIEQTAFIVPHASFRDPGTPLAMIQALVPYGGASNLPLDYGCWEDKTVFLKSPGSYGNEWSVRFDEGADEDDQGDDSQDLINGIVIQFNLGDGSALVASPISPLTVGGGKTSTTYSTDLLRVTDPEHPANKSGDTRWDVYDAGITSVSGAILIGQLILQLRNTRQWRGTVNLEGMQHTAAATMPPYMVHAGDYLVSAESVKTEPRRIVNTSYDIGNRKLAASCGANPDQLDVLLARAGIVLKGAL